MKRIQFNQIQFNLDFNENINLLKWNLISTKSTHFLNHLMVINSVEPKHFIYNIESNRI
jgi:hypothetical protein